MGLAKPKSGWQLDPESGVKKAGEKYVRNIRFLISLRGTL